MDPESTASPTTSNLRHMRSHNVLIFGVEQELDEIYLPTAFDILRYYFFLSARCKAQNKQFSYKTFTPEVGDKIIEIWGQLNINVIHRKSVTKKLNVLLDRYKRINKNGRRHNACKFQEFADSTKKIFYIGKCKCSLNLYRCNCGKIPSHLKEFMFDQHTERKLTIPLYESPIDTEVSKTLPILQSSGDATYQPNSSCVVKRSINETVEDIIATVTESRKKKSRI